eukprot:2535795-Rhodomonas_salina.3
MPAKSIPPETQSPYILHRCLGLVAIDFAAEASWRCSKNNFFNSPKQRTPSHNLHSSSTRSLVSSWMAGCRRAVLRCDFQVGVGGKEGWAPASSGRV